MKPKTVQVPQAKSDAKALEDTQIVPAMKAAKPDAPGAHRKAQLHNRFHTFLKS
ncbi:MAG: hypothetical protein H7Y12_09275 [Sphingobacteriaceae bacterium]|nr:hypothetical protein [Cytophagaceae bacterium]